MRDRLIGSSKLTFILLRTVDNNKLLEHFKAWAFPGLLSFITMVMYNDIKEMKQDVKVLLASSIEDRVKIDYLEQEVNKLRTRSLSFTDYNDTDENNNKIPDPYTQMLAVIPGTKEKSIYGESPDDSDKL